MKKQIEETLSHLTENIELYQNTVITDGETLNTILQQVSASLFFLESERATVHDQWQSCVQKFVLNGKPVNRAENEAHVLYPEMYKLRHVMDAGYVVVDSLRSNISWCKSEKNMAKS